jgi:hypothetical protein
VDKFLLVVEIKAFVIRFLPIKACQLFKKFSNNKRLISLKKKKLISSFTQLKEVLPDLKILL